ncbi:SET and MYND domain-containing protein 4 isoform X2 [Entelurus aequoreus]|uniref:SET and MYND domain-containing protein 4 isoform X2 n=1 Tax=Entelurus aequoreus TaxID=161455 RepID=UPI002B1D80CD|nr:SET and MYND domain-containing protein 4 isoform X2 [Entelurus aequoreus]
MDLPCLPWQDHVAQKWAGLEPGYKEHFTSLLEIEDIFKSALSVTTLDDACRLGSVCAGQADVHKDAEEAARCKERGNASFRNRKYTDATLHYSQGVCFAPPSSEHLALCYANRSAALYHLQHYQEALDDVEAAKRSEYPAHLLHKLEKRRTQCVAHLSSSDALGAPPAAPPTAPPTSGLSPHAAVGVSPKKGRHLVAAKRISAGEVILSERPYGCVLIPGAAMFGRECRRCHRCLIQTLRPVPCGGCAYSRYCSSACQTLAWEEHHRWECPLGRHLQAAGVMSQLALRVALTAGVENIRAAAESSERPDHAYTRTFRLLHHSARQSPGMRFLCAVTAATLSLALGGRGPPPPGAPPDGDAGAEWRLLGSAALRHLLQLRCNAQAVVTLQHQGPSDAPVQSSQEERVATALFPTLSLLNHACRPNTSLAFSVGEAPGVGVGVTVRASRGVSPGQEVTHCYGPHSSRMAARERRRLLLEQYYFLCECGACVRAEDEHEGGTSGLMCAECKDSPLMKEAGGDLKCSSCGRLVSSSEVTRRLQDVQQDLDLAVDLMERQRPAEALVLLDKSDGTLAETHPLQGQVADAMARAHATMGQWRRAAAHVERSAAAIGAQFGEESVEKARQLFKLAQLHFNGAATSSALAVIPEARRLLCRHCGPHCAEVQELDAMEDCFT